MRHAQVVELADTGDLKSPGQMRLCGFESRPGHWKGLSLGISSAQDTALVGVFDFVVFAGGLMIAIARHVVGWILG